MIQVPMTTLSQFVRLKRGYDLPDRIRRPGEIPVLGSFGITGWHDVAKSSGPGVTIGRSGASIGVATYHDGPFWPLNTALYAEDFLGNVPRYVYYLLDSIDFRDYNSGSAQPSLNRNYLEQIPVVDFGVQQQETIAAILGSIDDLIENNRRRVEVLEGMARTIYREWFVNFRYPGHEAVPLVDSALGPIPEGWHVAPASSALRINPRIKFDQSIEHPFIAMGDLDERGMGCRPSQTRSRGSGSKFQQGDTLFARITPCLENGKTGLVQCLNEGEVGLGSTEFIVLRGDAVGSVFTYCLAREEEFRKHAIASMSGASGRQRVRNECFDSYLLAVPPRGLADAYEAAASPLVAHVVTLSDETESLSQLRDLLLPRLVTGQIDVSTLNLDTLVEGQVA